MKNIHYSLLLILAISFCALSQSPKESIMLAKIKMVIHQDNRQDEVIINLLDNPASRQLLAQLPLRLDFSDYAGAEKIAYPSQKLTTQNTPTTATLTCDFTYYAPWGNLALFYRGMGSNAQLYALGHIASGKDKLAAIKQNFSASFERIE